MRKFSKMLDDIASIIVVIVGFAIIASIVWIALRIFWEIGSLFFGFLSFF